MNVPLLEYNYLRFRIFKFILYKLSLFEVYKIYSEFTAKIDTFNNIIFRYFFSLYKYLMSIRQ